MKHWIFLISSFSLLGQTQPGWVTVVDQREKAFSIEIPKGWQANGGMFRFNMVDARPFVDITSQDGRTNIRIGDATIPSYDLPNAQLQALHSIGPMVAPYATGEEFARKYGQARFGSMCQNVQVAKTGPTEPAAGGGANGIKITGGYAGFSCTINGRPMGAYVYSETLLVEPTFGSAGHWYVILLGSVIAPAAEGMAAGAMLNHSYKSLALNPEWMRTQGQLIAQLRKGILNTAAIVKQISDSEIERSKVQMREMARQSDAFNDVLLGQAYTRDTATGKNWVVPVGHGGTQWIDARGVVKESPMVPGPGYTRLEPASR
jgi:hypothetical protein